MYVLIDARLLHRPLSGLERVQRNLIRELAAHREIRRLRAVVTAGTRLPLDFPTGVETVAVHGTEDILAELLPADPADRPDLYHLTWFPDRSPRDLLLLPAAQAAVVEVHDAILNRHPEYHHSAAHWSWYDGFVRQLVAHADRLLVHSDSVAGEVERDLGGVRSRCDVAPLAVDPCLHADVDAAFVERFARERELPARYFVSLGKDYPHKGHATLFRALAAMPADVCVVVAGEKVWHDGRDTDELLRGLGLERRVRFLRGLGDDEVKALLQGSLGLVYPSLEEGFGLPPIEAMLRSVPVLAARAMAIPEVCGDAAWLFPPADHAALALLMQRRLAGGHDVRELVERGRRRAAEFSWARCADRVLACYANARAEAGRRGASRQAGLPALLANIARCPFREADELAAWQDRCRGAERHVRDVEGNRDDVLRQLRELQARVGVPVSPQPEPVSFTAPAGPRWSLRRRLRKLRDGLRRTFPGPST